MRTLILAAVLPALLTSPSAALAHAELDRASPRVGSTVAPAPRTLSLWFTQNVEPAMSTIEEITALEERLTFARTPWRALETGP